MVTAAKKAETSRAGRLKQWGLTDNEAQYLTIEADARAICARSLPTSKKPLQPDKKGKAPLGDAHSDAVFHGASRKWKVKVKSIFREFCVEYQNELRTLYKCNNCETEEERDQLLLSYVSFWNRDISDAARTYQFADSSLASSSVQLVQEVQSPTSAAQLEDVIKSVEDQERGLDDDKLSRRLRTMSLIPRDETRAVTVSSGSHPTDTTPRRRVEEREAEVWAHVYILLQGGTEEQPLNPEQNWCEFRDVCPPDQLLLPHHIDWEQFTRLTATTTINWSGLGFESRHPILDKNVVYSADSVSLVRACRAELVRIQTIYDKAAADEVKIPCYLTIKPFPDGQKVSSKKRSREDEDDTDDRPSSSKKTCRTAFSKESFPRSCRKAAVAVEDQPLGYFNVRTMGQVDPSFYQITEEATPTQFTTLDSIMLDTFDSGTRLESKSDPRPSGIERVSTGKINLSINKEGDSSDEVVSASLADATTSNTQFNAGDLSIATPEAPIDTEGSIVSWGTFTPAATEVGTIWLPEDNNKSLDTVTKIQKLMEMPAVEGHKSTPYEVWLGAANKTWTHRDLASFRNFMYDCRFTDSIDAIRHPRATMPLLPGQIHKPLMWYQFYNAQTAFRLGQNLGLIFEGTQTGLGKTLQCLVALPILNLIRQSIKHHIRHCKAQGTYSTHHLLSNEYEVRTECPTLAINRSGSDGKAVLPWFNHVRCDCEYRKDKKPPPIPAFGYSLVLGLANAFSKSVVKTFTECFNLTAEVTEHVVHAHATEVARLSIPPLRIVVEHSESVNQIEDLDLRKKVGPLTRAELNMLEGYTIATQVRRNTVNELQKAFTPRFELSSVIVLSTPQSWIKRELGYKTLLLGMFIQDEAHRWKSDSVSITRVFNPSRGYYRRETQESESGECRQFQPTLIVAVSASLAIMNIPKDFAIYFKMAEARLNEQGIDIGNEKFGLHNFSTSRIKQLGDRWAQTMKSDAVKAGSEKVSEMLVIRNDPDTVAAGYPVAVSNHTKRTHTVKWSDEQKNSMQESISMDAKRLIMELGLVGEGEEGGLEKHAQTLKQHLSVSVYSRLVNYFPSWTRIIADWQVSTRARLEKKPNAQIKLVIARGSATGQAAVLPWSQFTNQEKDDFLQCRGTVGSIEDRNFVRRPASVCANHLYGPFHDVMPWVHDALPFFQTLLKVLKISLAQDEKDDAVASYTHPIQPALHLWTVDEPIQTIIIHRWLQVCLLKAAEGSEWWIKPEWQTRVRPAAWNFTLNPKEVQTTLEDFESRESDTTILIATAKVAGTSHNFGHCKWHFQIGEITDHNLQVQRDGRTVRANYIDLRYIERITSNSHRDLRVVDRSLSTFDYLAYIQDIGLGLTEEERTQAEKNRVALQVRKKGKKEKGKKVVRYETSEDEEDSDA